VHLAYLTAVNHNIQDMIEPLKESLKDDLPVLDVKLLAKHEFIFY